MWVKTNDDNKMLINLDLVDTVYIDVMGSVGRIKAHFPYDDSTATLGVYKSDVSKIIFEQLCLSIEQEEMFFMPEEEEANKKYEQCK